MEDIIIKNNPEENRFETTVEGHLAVVEYRMLRKKIALIHTEVPKALGGKGVAGALARFALGYARENELLVKPYCPYIRAYIKRHPEYADLVDPEFEEKQ